MKPLLFAAMVVFVPFLSGSKGAETPRASPSAQNVVVAIALPAVNEPVDLPTIKKICAQFGLHALWAKIERDPPSLPFKSDGCSAWPDEWQGVSLYPAAFVHDLKYWAGYPGEHVERLVADAELMIDVARVLKSTVVAETMFKGVRLGGTEYFRAPFSWGFGRRPAAPASQPPQPTPRVR